MIRKCNKPVYTTDGKKFRGKCIRPLNHNRGGRGDGGHSNNLCVRCGLKPKACQSYCRNCANTSQQERRRRNGVPLLNRQQPEQLHVFPCGCKGRLPRRGESNLFAVRGYNAWVCRVLIILSVVADSKQRGYKPISKDVSHSVIRGMMENPNCTLCGKLLKWSFGSGKTPHLHHNHVTGEPLGFAHNVCNFRAERKEIKRMKASIIDDPWHDSEGAYYKISRKWWNKRRIYATK